MPKLLKLHAGVIISQHSLDKDNENSVGMYQAVEDMAQRRRSLPLNLPKMNDTSITAAGEVGKTFSVSL